MNRANVYIDAYDSYSCAGDTQELMESIYSQSVKITQNSEYIPHKSVALGAFSKGEFFAHLKRCVLSVLERSVVDDFHSTLLIVGSSVGGMKKSEQLYFRDKDYSHIDVAEHDISTITTFLDKSFAFASTKAISTACTSSANALLLAKRYIEIGAYDSVLVVGADALCYTTVCGFDALGVLSTKPSTPFTKDREGMNVAEAVAVLHVTSQKQEDSIALLGAGASSDAFHITQPDPEAKGAISAMKAALEDGNIEPSAIDYINAHGTGTQANDATEALATELLFGSTTPISSTKAITGHTLGAAGALEAIISCEVIKRNLIPPQSSLGEVENEHIYIPKEPISKEVHYLLSNSFAFGGNNTALLFGATS